MVITMQLQVIVGTNRVYILLLWPYPERKAAVSVSAHRTCRGVRRVLRTLLPLRLLLFK
jgi:hypothetical protein